MTALDSFSGQFKIYDNAIDVTVGSGAAFDVVFQEGCAVTIDASTGEYRVTSVADDNANATFRAIYNGYEVYQTFTIAKARAVGGTSKYVELATTDYFFAYDANNLVKEQTTTLSLTKHNLSAATQWRIKRLDNGLIAEGTAASLLSGDYVSEAPTADIISLTGPLFDDLCRQYSANALVIEAVVANGASFSSDRVTIYQMLQRSRVAWDNVSDPNGTKPEDNATVGAPVGTNVGGRPVADVLDDLDFNADTVLDQTFRVDAMESVFDARTFVEGQPVGTVLLNERSQRQTDVSAINTALDLIGAKSPDGTAWVLDAATVQTEPGKTLASTLDELAVKTSDHEASIINLNEVLVSSDGVTAKSVLQINVDGHITGMVNTNDGTTGDLTFVMDTFKFVDPNGGAPIVPFSYADGVIRMTDVEVNSIKVGSGGTVGAPSTVSATSSVSGAGITNYLTILSQTVTLASAGTIFANASVAQSFPDGDETWNTRLRINGQVVYATGGEKTLDSVPMSGALPLPAGSYAVEILFAAHSSVSAHSRTLFVLPIY